MRGLRDGERAIFNNLSAQDVMFSNKREFTLTIPAVCLLVN